MPCSMLQAGILVFAVLYTLGIAGQSLELSSRCNALQQLHALLRAVGCAAAQLGPLCMPASNQCYVSFETLSAAVQAVWCK